MEESELKKEFDEFQSKHYKNKHTPNFLYFAILLLAVFALPDKPLSGLSILRNFTGFMSEIFLNIKIYASNYAKPELCEFYFSFVWVVCVVMAVYFIYKIPAMFDYDERYYGVGKYQHNGIMQKKFFEVAKFSPKNYFYTFLGYIVLFIFVYANFAGFLRHTFVWNYTRNEFGLFVVAIIQLLSIYAFFGMVCDTMSSIINLKRFEKLIKGERNG